MLNEVLNKRVNFTFIQNRDALYGVFKTILCEVYILKPRYMFTKICPYIYSEETIVFFPRHALFHLFGTEKRKTQK